MNIRHIFVTIPLILVMFWNLENFFDYRDSSGGQSDREFSAAGERRWTGKRFYSKCNAVAKTVLWIADIYGELPDVIGFAEVENSFVLHSILKSTALAKTPYRYVHFDSPDPRGIDVALLYRSDLYRIESAKPCHICDSSGIMKTRDILLVTLKSIPDDSVSLRHTRPDRASACHYLVNHHPSKYAGAAVSAPKRLAAVTRLRSLCDSLTATGADDLVVAMGDFNDTPDNPLFDILESGNMRNMALDGKFRNDGTIRFEGKWELIDMFFVSRNMSDSANMEIVHPPFLMTADLKHGGEKPLRTYVGPRYAGGVSDHSPVILRF